MQNQQMMLPPWMWFQAPGLQQQQLALPDIIVPARVNKALEFFTIVSQKTMPRAAVNDINIETIPGQKLTDEEQTALATACNLLSKYFSGQLTPDVWEDIKVDAARKQVENNNLPGRVLMCFACAPNPPRSDCPLCNGSGKVMITSVGSYTRADDEQ